MDDMMGLFDSNGGGSGAGGQDDLMNGFAGLDMGGAKPAPPQTQLHGGGGEKKTNDDLLGMF